MLFKLQSKFKPAGDQPKAIKELVNGLQKGIKQQTLLGVTGSGKTFTMANVIAKWQRPALVIAHNKTLAAQLCQEFREFFPQNEVCYFVSYYDYYQPEAYLPGTDTYIDKEAMINDEIDRLRHAATQALLTRRDVIVVASVSCIYNLGEPERYRQAAVRLEIGQVITRADLLRSLVALQYERTNADLKRGTFRMRGEVVEIMPPHFEIIYRVEMPGQTVGKIEELDAVSRKTRQKSEACLLFPAKHFVTPKPQVDKAISDIRAELADRLVYFKKEEKLLEIERLERRTRYDLELIKQIGFCHGIENYSRHFDGRAPGEPPATLLDYFSQGLKPETSNLQSPNWLLIIDESHVTIPQLNGMYEGDRARKKTLIEYGFRLPSAIDNRPLKFAEFEQRMPQVVFTSATPGHYELQYSQQIVEQIIRPTGLIDPEVLIRPVTEKCKMKNEKCKIFGNKLETENKNQIDDLIEQIRARLKRNERVLVTTLTKKMAEDLTNYLADLKIKVQYLHSDVDTLDRIAILTDFRRGKYDVLVGVNLLREGLDLPEVSLVAILDADKEGFLRSETSLIQTIGRAARNAAGQVILYADEATGSIKRAVAETDRRRRLQMQYNQKHHITPQTIKKNVRNLLEEFGITQIKNIKSGRQAVDRTRLKDVLDLDLKAEKGRPLEEIIKEKETQMKQAAKELEFELAAILRDEIKLLRIKSVKTKQY